MASTTFDLTRIENEFPGICTDTERKAVAEYAARVIPVLTGEQRPTNPQQAEFLDVMRRRSAPRTDFHRMWLKLYCAHANLVARDKLERQAETIKTKLVREHEHALASVNSREATSQELLVCAFDALRAKGALHLVTDPAGEWASFCAAQVTGKIETLTVEEIQFFADHDFPGLREADFYKLNNRLLDLDVAGPLLAQVKRRFPSHGFNPANAFAVYANTDGQ